MAKFRKAEDVVGQANQIEYEGRVFDRGRVFPRIESDPNLAKFGKYDTNVPAHTTPAEQIAYRIQNQTTAQALGNGLVQSVGELGLGTAEGIGYLLDFEQHANLIKGTEQEFGNWFSDIARNYQDKIRENFPIYGGEEVFNPLSGKWWANQLPMLATSLSLVIPATGSVKLLGEAGRLLKARSVLAGLMKLSPEMRGVASLAAQGIEGAVASRYMESTMEAAEAMQNKIQEYTSQGMSEEEARIKAGDVAASVFYTNQLALLTDIPQYLLLFKGLGPFKEAVQKVGGKGKFLKELAAQIISEGGEEAFQYGVQQSAAQGGNGMQRIGNTLANMANDFPQYFEDKDFWKSVVGGAMGGAVFHTVGHAINERINKVNKQYEEVKNLVAQGRDAEAQAAIAAAAVEAADDPTANQLAEFADPQEKTFFQKIKDRLFRERTARSSDPMGAEKAADIVKAEAKAEAAQEAQQKVDEAVSKYQAAKPNPKVNKDGEIKRPEKDDLLLVLNKKLDNLARRHKNNPEKTAIIEKLRKKYEQEYTERTPVTDLDSSTEKADIVSKLQQRAQLEFEKEVTTNAVNKSSTPKGQEEYAKQKQAEVAAKEKEQIDNLMNSPTVSPQQLVTQLDNTTDPEQHKRISEFFEQKINEETARIAEPGEEYTSYDDWAKVVTEQSPFIAYMAEKDKEVAMRLSNDLKRIWQEAKGNKPAPVSGEAVSSSIGDVQVVSEGENAVTIATPDPVNPVDTINKETLALHDTPPAIKPEEEEKPLGPPAPPSPIVTNGEGADIEQAKPVTPITPPVVGGFGLLTRDINHGKQVVNGRQVYVAKFEGDSAYPQEDAFLDDKLTSNFASAAEQREFLRSFNPEEHKEVFFVLDRGIAWNRSDRVASESAVIHAVVEKNGKLYSLGILKGLTRKDLTKDEQDNISAIRNELWNKPGQLVRSEGTATIRHIYPGTLNYTKKRNNLTEFTTLAKSTGTSPFPNNKVYLGVSNEIGEILTNLPPDIAAKVVPAAGTSGMSYVLVNAPDGNYYWSRLFVHDVENVPGVLARIEELLAIANTPEWASRWKEIRAAIQSYVKWTVADREGNKRIEPDFRENLPTVKKFQTNGVFDPKKLMEAWKLEKRPIQIDASRINIGDYNASVANRLYSNLDLKHAFHTPGFVLNAYKVPQTVQVEKVTDPFPLLVKDITDSELESIIKNINREHDPNLVRRFEKDKWNLQTIKNYLGDEADIYPDGTIVIPTVLGESSVFSKVTPTDFISRSKKPVPVSRNVKFNNLSEELTQLSKDKGGLTPNVVQAHFDIGAILAMDMTQYSDNPERLAAIQAKYFEDRYGKSAPTSTTTDKTKRRTGGGFKPRVVTGGEVSKINVAKAVSWLQQRLPSDISIEVVNGLIKLHDGFAWGTTSNALVTLSDIAAKGTEYHEAFHVVFGNLLTQEERRTILKEATKLYGDTFNEEELEERLAEEFREYVQSQHSIPYRIKRFFRKLLQWLNLVPRRYEIDNLFSKIERGDYRNAPVVSTMFAPRYRRTSSLSAGEVRVATGIILHIFEAVRDYVGEKEYKSALSPDVDKNFILSTSLPYSVLGDLKYHYLDFKDSPDFNKKNFWEIVRGLRPDITGIDEETGSYTFEGPPRIGQLYTETLRGLSERGFKIRLEDNTVFEGTSQTHDVEIAEDDNLEQRENWAISEISVSPKEKLTPRLKRWIANIPSGNGDRLGIGFDEFFSPNHIYPILQREIGQSTTVENMKQKMLNSDLPFMNRLVEQIAQAEDPESLYTELFVHIAQKEHPEFKTVNVRTEYDPELKDSKTSWRVFDSNSAQLRKAIVNDLFDSFKEENVAKALAVFDSKEHGLENPETKKNKTFDKERLSKAFNFLGFSIPESVIANMNTNKAYYVALKLRSGLRLDKREFGSRFKDFVNEIKSLYPQDYQDAHFSVEGKQVYEWINSSFFGRLLNRTKAEFLSHFKRDPLYNLLPVIRELEGNPSVELPFKLAITDGIKYNKRKKGTAYDNFSEKDFYLTTLSYYFNNSNKSKEGYFILPILSDSPTLAAVRMPKSSNLDTTEEIKGVYDDIIQVIRFEWERVHREGGNNIKNYNKNKSKVWLFKAFEPLILSDTFDVPAIKARLREVIAENTNQLKTKLIEVGILDENGIPKDSWDNGIENTDRFLMEFSANYMLQHSQIMLLSTLDPAYYKGKNIVENLGDFYKRAKQVWSPGTYINTHNVYTNSAGERWRPGYYTPNDKMRIRILADKVQNKESDHYDKIAAIIGEEAAAPYKSIEVADGQSYIDIVSWKDREVGLGRWDDLKEAAFQYMSEGTLLNSREVKNLRRKHKAELEKLRKKADKTEAEEARLKELGRIQIPKHSTDMAYKPYVFTHLFLNDILFPFQKKDSEFIIPPAYGMEGTPFYNPFFKELLEDMGYNFKDKKYDLSKRKYEVASFESAIKVGGFSSITDTAEENIREIDFSDWRIQQETPEHHIESAARFGTQIMKLITADLDKSADYTLPDGSTIKGNEIIDEYSRLMVEDIKRSYDFLMERLQGDTLEETYNNLVKIIREEVINRGMGDQFLEALDQAAATGETNLPLWHPLHAYRIESLLNSMFKSNVTTQKWVSGFSLVNTSAYGFERKPQLKFEGKRLVAMEAYVPIMNNTVASYANEQGIVDAQGIARMKKDIEDGKIPNYLRGISYRIPTENKYSMFNIEIIGFLPTDAGSIILPEEVTVIAGLDFDIDKMYGFTYAGNKYREELKRLNDIIERDYDKNILKQYDATTENLWKTIFSQYNSENEYTPEEIAEVLEENGSSAAAYKALEELADKWDAKVASDNRKIDLFRAILESEDIAKIALNPGGFSRLKANNAAIEKKQAGNVVTDYMNPTTLGSVSQRMMAGKALIGFAATFNVAHALWMNSRVPITMDKGFVFDGVAHANLSGKLDTAKESSFITRNIAECLAAFVDNGKDPQAEKFNMNLFTAEVGLSMLAAGVPLKTVQYFLAQPSLRRLSSMYFNNGGDYSAKQLVMQEIEKYGGPVHKTKIPVNNFNTADLYDRLGQSWTEQGDIMQAFGIYLLRSGDVGNFVRATRVPDKGAGPGQGDNMAKIYTYDGADATFLIGAAAFLSEEGMVKQFMDSGIKDANQFIVESAYFPNLNTEVVANTLGFIHEIQGYSPTADQINDIYRDMFTYMGSGFSFFKTDAAFFKELPAKVQEAQKKIPDNKFVSRLSFTQDNVIQFRAVTGTDYSEEQEIREAWEDMMYDDTIIEKQTGSDSITTKTYSGKITELKDNQIFVFGSNPEGRHGAGAAKLAVKFGAKYGQGRGLQGQAYALPTKNLKAGFVEPGTGITYTKQGEKSLTSEQIENNISELYQVALANPDKEFLIAYSSEGRNLNGYSPKEMAEMFSSIPIPKNIVFEEGFSKLLSSSTNINYTVSDLSKDLVKYAFRRNGFRFGFNTFSHLQPVSFYSQLTGEEGKLTDYMAGKLGMTEDFGQFRDFFRQYVHNNFENLSFVPTVRWGKKEEQRNVSMVKFDARNNPIGIFTDNQAPFSRNVLGEMMPNPYIKLFANGEWHLFKNDGSTRGIYQKVKVDITTDSFGNRMYQSYDSEEKREFLQFNTEFVRFQNEVRGIPSKSEKDSDNFPSLLDDACNK